MYVSLNTFLECRQVLQHASTGDMDVDMGLGVGTRACASLTSCSALPSQCLVLMELLPHSHCHSFGHHASVPIAK